MECQADRRPTVGTGQPSRVQGHRHAILGQADGTTGLSAVPIRPVAVTGVASTVFTQTPAMASNFSLPVAGVITVTNYISVTSGTPAAPLSITATLRYNGITFATLSNPSLTNLGGGIYRLVWTGAVASTDQCRPRPGHQLDRDDLPPNLSFRILYDSSTYPSRIDLPATTVIKVDSLAIYDAPYPGGTCSPAPPTGRRSISAPP